MTFVKLQVVPMQVWNRKPLFIQFVALAVYEVQLAVLCHNLVAFKSQQNFIELGILGRIELSLLFILLFFFLVFDQNFEEYIKVDAVFVFHGNRAGFPSVILF